MPAYLIMIAIGVGIIVLLTLIVSFMRKSVYVSVSAFSWERSITLEKLEWVKGTSYKGFPKDSRNGKKRQENYRYSTTVSREQYVYRPNRYVPDKFGADDYGTEKYEWVTEPVTEWKWGTRTKYEYEVPQWKSGRTLLASGRSRDDVRWPDYVYAGHARERETKKKEQYMVHFVAENGKRYSKSLARNVWAELDAKAWYLLKTTCFGRVTEMQPAQRKPAQIYQPPK